MWFPFVFLVVLMTVLFVVALVAIVRRQLVWEDERAAMVSEEVRRVVRSNYRIVVGTIIAVYALFLGTTVYMFFILKDMNLL